MIERGRGARPAIADGDDPNRRDASGGGEPRDEGAAKARAGTKDGRATVDAAAVFASQQIDCTTKAPSGPIVPAQTPGSRELESSGDQYSFNWKTERAWQGTCRQLIIRLQDVADPVAFLRFT